MSGEDLCSRLGARYPILQAPTGSIAGPELAIAVANAGGVGALGLTWTDPATASDYVRQVREATAGPFQVNFALAFPPHALAASLEAGAPIITFSWGDPGPLVEMAHSFGALVGIQTTTGAAAARACELGADFLICQGVEAGGHVQASRSLNHALEEVLAAGSIPVVAAGGIATGCDIAEVMARGASGAVLGTRFVATRESRAHGEYKEHIVRSSGTDTVLTPCYDGGWPFALHRVLRNSTLDRWESAGCPPPGARPGEGDIIARSSSGEPILRYEDTAPRQGMEGAVGEMCLYAGTGCDSIDDIPSAADLVARLWNEATAYDR
jgi:nitronate monooxygenase